MRSGPKRYRIVTVKVLWQDGVIVGVAAVRQAVHVGRARVHSRGEQATCCPVTITHSRNAGVEHTWVKLGLVP